MGDVRLIVQADDCGMCRAVNEGIALAKTDGILTQTSVMAPTPWFTGRAYDQASRTGDGTARHAHLRLGVPSWGPLTAAISLRDADRLFKRTVEGAAEGDPAEAVAEAHAQIDRALSVGLELSYIDPHMGLSLIPAYEARVSPRSA